MHKSLVDLVAPDLIADASEQRNSGVATDGFLIN